MEQQLEKPTITAGTMTEVADMSNGIEVPTQEGKAPGKEKGPPVSNYWRILSYGNQLEHAVLCLAILCAAASGVALPLMNIVFGTLAGNFNDYFLPGTDVTEKQFKHTVAQNSLYILYLFIGKFLLSYTGMFCFRTSGLRISAAMRLEYMEALFKQPVRKLDEVSAGMVANTITTSANQIQLSISDRLSSLFQSLALIIAAYAIAFRYSWALTLATTSAILFVVVVYSITTPFTLKLLQRVVKADEKHATVAAEAVSSIRTVFALGAEAKITKKHSSWVDESHKHGMRLAPQIALQLAPMYFAIYAAYALAFWFGLKLYRGGHIGNVSTVIIVFFSVLIVTSVMGMVVQPLMNIAKAISASTAFFDIMDAEQVASGGKRAPEVSAQGDIEFEDVTFAYPTRPSIQVLKGFSATFQKGKTTALVGPSGSGKSTIVSLLERWYEVSQGRSQSPQAKEKDSSVATSTGSIMTEGHHINEFELKWWRSQIGLVQQEPFLFNDTIEKNVSYGLIGTKWEKAKEEEKLGLVKHACHEAFADQFIDKLPKGYSTLVGEGGIKLSGGQRQRIAIARSIIKQPAVLILDEATSAIDVQGEKLVQEALDRASKNRTTIMIAHRLSTIRKADHIIVLRNGSKVEEGTHEQLLSFEDGLYTGLVQAQMIEEHETGSTTEFDATAVPLETTASHQLMQRTRTASFASRSAATTDSPKVGKELSESSYQRRGFFKTVGVFLYEQREHWRLYLLLLVAAMGCGAAYALQAWFFAQLIVAFTYTGQRLIDAGNFWALMFFILALAVAACYGVLGSSSITISTYVGTHCRKDYFKNTLKMPIPFFDHEDNSSGSVMSRISGDPKQIQELLGPNSAFPIISIFNVIGSVIIAFYFGWKLTLVTFFAVLPVIIGASFMRLRYEVKFEDHNSKIFDHSSQFATEAISAFRTVSSLTMEDVIIEKYSNLLQDQIRKTTRKATYAMLVFALTDSVELCGMALTFWYGGQLLASREYQPLQFFVIYAAIIQGAQAAGQYLSFTSNLAYATASANRILKLRSAAVDGRESVTTLGASKPMLGAVTFSNLDFTYPTNSLPLFSKLNIHIEAGQFVAFVGPSGCGKTTTISLLERFYEPTAGTICLDDQDITSLEPTSYRRNLALVSQEPRLFSGTIQQNLLLGVEESETPDHLITQACRDAEIHDFIVSLPEGYNTELGQHTQTALSGGQKQRLCLARALLRRPKLLLLDEATSSLDSQSEKLVQGAIERLANQRNMTVIAVAHRLATIQKADVIFVFGERNVDGKEGSKIVEKGSHRDLLARRGVYWSMCQAQALDR